MKKGKRSARSATPICRDLVPDIITTVGGRSLKDAPKWNVVEALEVLIDSGNFSAARQVAKRIIPTVMGDGRERLFFGYMALCDLMTTGEQTESLAALESLYVRIHNGGHSTADRIRIGLLLARALSVCVCMGSVGEEKLLRARQVLGAELERAARSGEKELHAQVALELSKSYLHSPTSDPRAALGILRTLEEEVTLASLREDLQCDIARMFFQAARRVGGDIAARYTEGDLREKSGGFGGVSRGLVELAIARRAPSDHSEALQKAAELLEENRYIAGAFEALFLLATAALEREFNSVAERYLQRALALAEEAGFLHGKVLASIGLFQAATISGNLESARRFCGSIVADLDCEMVLGSQGLNISAAQQMIGDLSGSLDTVYRSEKYYQAHGMKAAESFAAHALGVCHARMGNWNRAKQVWKRAIDLDDARCAFLQSCERRGVYVQSLVMCDMLSKGMVSAATAKKAEGVLFKGYDLISHFGDAPEAQQIAARLSMVHGQLFVMTKDYVGALRHLARARELFEHLGSEHDVAVVDSVMGFSMIELGKAGTPSMLEEATLTLQRPLQTFSGTEYARIRWKLLYYLAIAAYMVGEQKGPGVERHKWRDLSAGWLRGAIDESARAEKQSPHPWDSQLEADFSPGLKPEVMEPLKKALGLVGEARRRKGVTAQSEPTSPEGGHFH